jgi:gliding motility-associated-like protein
MKRLSIILLFLFSVLLCMAQDRGKTIPGKILIKFKTAPHEQIIQAQPQLATQGVTATQPLSLGLASIDALNREYKATRMQRVFLPAGKHEERHQRHGLHLWYELTINEALDPVAVSEQYGKDAYIEWAEPAPVIQYAADPFPNDPSYAKQWHYNNTGQASGTTGMDIRLPQAWEKTTGDPRVIVAVVDGGVDYAHQDLNANMWRNTGEIPGNGIDDDGNGFIDDVYGFNFISGRGLNPDIKPYGPAPITADRHGTHVAGTIAAATNNGIGVAGIAGGDGTHQGARIMSCQVIEENTDAYINAAIVYAADNGAVILQNSWSLTSGSGESVRAAIKYFIRCAGTIDDNCTQPAPGTPMKGGIAIFAAGNENTSTPTYTYPTYYDEVVTVAAVNNKGRRAYYSNYGDWVDVSAPGGDYFNTGYEGGATAVESRTVLSTLPGNDYGWMQGTSMACPHVSGVAALALSRYGSETYTPDMLRDRLLLATTPLPDEPRYLSGQMGSGLVNAFQAVSDFVAVTGITLPANHSVQVGRTDTLHADIQPADATDRRIQWTSSDPGIATIDEKKGIVTGIAEGAATITGTTNDGGFTATTIVAVVPVLADSIRLAPQALMLNNGTTNRVAVLYYPSDVTQKKVEWHSRNTDIAEVDSHTGQITGVNLGSAYIVATIKDGTAEEDSCLVTVVQPVTGVELLPAGAIRLVKSDTLTLHAEIIPFDAQNKNVSWRTSASKVVTVNDGLLTAKAVGAATITVRTDDGDIPATAQVEVYEAEHAPQGFSPNGDGINDYFELTLDSRENYSLTVFDRSGQVHYRSSNYQNNWDGVANTGAQSGKKLLPGTYYYSLTGNISGNKKTGYVIIRY